VLTIPTQAMARIKREERDKGKKLAMVELEATAKKAGFASAEEMMKAASQFRRQAPKGGTPQRTQPAATRTEAKPAVTPPPAEARPVDRAARRAEREHEKTLEEVRRLNRARASEEKKRKAAERQLEAMQAEMTLRTSAVRAGVQDIDYALELLRRKIQGKTADDLKTFNEDEFFAKELRTSHPYLYGVTDIPANTSAGGPTRETPKPGAQPKPPAPGAPANGVADARSLTPQQYADMLAKHGIKNPTLGM
jgi:hypothetical protein